VGSSAVLALLRDGEVDLVINTIPPPAAGAAMLAKGSATSVASGASRSADPSIIGDYLVRRTAVDHAVPLLTNPNLVAMFAAAIARHTASPMVGLTPSSLFEYYKAEPVSEAWTAPTEFH
jgi:hypothetical protein